MPSVLYWTFNYFIMKKNIFLISIFLLANVFACNEDEILEEVPLDFLSTENSYVVASDFKKGINRLHEQVRVIFEVNGSFENWLIYYGTGDLGYVPNRLPNQEVNSPNNSLFPTSSWVSYYWTKFYRIIFDANVIINRIDDPELEFDSDEQRTQYKAEALFFRAWTYRMLASLYGGVPLVLNEIKAPKRDFVRASRDEVWAQCVKDLVIAAANLPGADEVEDPGRICSGAANHLLAECYIALKQWDNAIDAATEVINSGEFALMTSRFGSRKNEPGDVYWDLFRRGNQNRTSGNTEGIWVIQFEHNVPGGENEGLLI